MNRNAGQLTSHGEPGRYHIEYVVNVASPEGDRGMSLREWSIAAGHPGDLVEVGDYSMPERAWRLGASPTGRTAAEAWRKHFGHVHRADWETPPDPRRSAVRGRASTLPEYTTGYLTVEEVPLDSDGCDPGGACWGRPKEGDLPLFCVTDEEGRVKYMRAPSAARVRGHFSYRATWGDSHPALDADYALAADEGRAKADEDARAKLASDSAFHKWWTRALDEGLAGTTVGDLADAHAAYSSGFIAQDWSRRQQEKNAREAMVRRASVRLDALYEVGELPGGSGKVPFGALAVGAVGLAAIGAAVYYAIQPKAAAPKLPGSTPQGLPAAPAVPFAPAPAPRPGAVQATPAPAPVKPRPASAAYSPTPAAPASPGGVSTNAADAAALTSITTAQTAAWGTPGHQTAAQAAQMAADQAATAAYNAPPENKGPEVVTLSETENPPSLTDQLSNAVSSIFGGSS